MLPPYELEKNGFRKSMKGYNIAEVDEHMEFIIDKYTELYRAYNEIEQRCAEAESELAAYKKNEDAIRRALISAEREQKRIVDRAQERSRRILESARSHCDSILADFKEQIRQERNTLTTLKAQVEEFKQRIFSQYQRHIELLESISPDGDTGAEWILPDSDYTGKVLAQVVLDVEKSDTENAAKAPAPEDLDISVSDDIALSTFLGDSARFIDRDNAGRLEDDYPEAADVDIGSDTDNSDDDEGGDTLLFGLPH